MRKYAPKLLTVIVLALAAALFLPQRAAADDDDPPSRVARLSYAHGAVSFQPAGSDDWVSTAVNRPMTTGDKLWVDNDARAELNLGSASIRLSSTTGFSFLNLADNAVQLRLTEGTLRIRVKRLGENETFEVDTPNLAFSVLRPGTYKIKVNEEGDTTVITVRSGEGEVTGGGQAFTVHPDQVGTFAGTDQLNGGIESYDGDEDNFDHWCSGRDRREDHSESARYVSSEAIGYEDLDDYGGWRPVPEYGTVWFPHTTVVGWAPYRYGHWVWISPWGWTWVDDEPWGFAPFHYGRWVTVGGAWGWVPCAPAPVVVGVAYVRPVYAPALVAWVGGAHWGVGVGVGSGVAWFPLGPREVYMPSYPVSRTYVNNVNVTNTAVNTTVVNNYYNNTVVNKNVNVNNTNVTNVTNITYVNQSVPGAVTATSHEAFTSAKPVGTNMVKVDAREVARAPVNATTPAVVPQQKSMLGGGASATVKPPATFQDRAVVAKATPPPPPPSFAKQHEAIQANGGKPLATSQVRQLQPEQPKAAVRIAPPAGQVASPTNAVYKPGQPRNNEDNRPGQQTKADKVEVNNNRPSTPSSGNERPNGQPNKPTGDERNKQPASVRPSNSDNNRPSTPSSGNERSDQPASVRPSNPTNDRPSIPAPNAQPNRPTSNERNDKPASARPSNPGNDRPSTPSSGNERNNQPVSVRPSNPDNNRPSTPSSGNERPNGQPNKPTGNERNDRPVAVQPSNPTNERPSTPPSNAQPNKPAGNERNDRPAAVRPSNPPPTAKENPQPEQKQQQQQRQEPAPRQQQQAQPKQEQKQQPPPQVQGHPKPQQSEKPKDKDKDKDKDKPPKP